MFSLIENDEPTIEIDFKGEQFILDCSFNTVLETMQYVEDPKLSIMAIIEIAYTEFVIHTTADDLDILEKQEVVNFIFSDVLNEKELENIVYDRRGDPMPTKKKETDNEDEGEIFSFEQDASFIYSSFLQAYGMDLHKQLGKLSWNKFRILLRDLPTETKFKKVLEIREWKPEKGTSAKEKLKMKELQDSYAIVVRPRR